MHVIMCVRREEEGGTWRLATYVMLCDSARAEEVRCNWAQCARWSLVFAHCYNYYFPTWRGLISLVRRVPSVGTEVVCERSPVKDVWVRKRHTAFCFLGGHVMPCLHLVPKYAIYCSNYVTAQQ
uniref:Uncharacterized protein n=1 Tax=Trypanosoma vivax (strain Y486) TaxID=1055687 RepID=G0U9L7_TRYVY|nr:hypothetical protein TVY486_1117880 [Trypanosoma vivax Y486]